MIEKEEWRKWSIQKQHTLLFVRSSITAKLRENDVSSKGQPTSVGAAKQINKYGKGDLS